MADDRLKNFVLSLADTDEKLSEPAKLVVLAAMEGGDDLAEVLSDNATPAELVQALTAEAKGDTKPVGAYLYSITVRGFRGIGPAVTLPFQPGPGLIVVAGRNGSGKSTLAEGLELALTGTNSRWKNKAAVWSQNWRNLHAGEPAQIRVKLAEEGLGATVIGVDWPAGDVDVDELKTWVQRDGKKREDAAVLGWAGALEMYRPLLSYDELGGILEGRPSDFYDQLHKLLGLEQLTTAMARLEDEVKQLKQPSAAQKTVRDGLRPKLESHDDPRALKALVELKKRRPDLNAVRPLITEGAAPTMPSAWSCAQNLATPDEHEVAQACQNLRLAADAEKAEVGRADVLNADRVQLLELSLEFHASHGDQKCPVCGSGDLTAQWVAAARSRSKSPSNQRSLCRQHGRPLSRRVRCWPASCTQWTRRPSPTLHCHTCPPRRQHTKRSHPCPLTASTRWPTTYSRSYPRCVTRTQRCSNRQLRWSGSGKTPGARSP
ncbi:AAA family ATPase [Mycolicibacterium peregrinum]